MILHVDEEGALDGGQDLLLVHRVFDLFQFHHLSLVQNLQSMVGLVGLVFDQHHTTKGPSSEGLHAVEIIQNSCALYRTQEEGRDR